MIRGYGGILSIRSASIRSDLVDQADMCIATAKCRCYLAQAKVLLNYRPHSSLWRSITFHSTCDSIPATLSWSCQTPHDALPPALFGFSALLRHPGRKATGSHFSKPALSIAEQQEHGQPLTLRHRDSFPFSEYEECRGERIRAHSAAVQDGR